MSNYEFWNELDHIFEAVLAYQKKNIEFNKTFISPWVRLGHVFPRDDSSQQTLQALLHAAELDPEHAQNWTDLGDAFHKMGNLEEAIEAYRKAVELNPAAAWPKSNLALSLATQGNYQEAVSLYKESLESFLDNRDKAVTWNRLGNAYRKLGDFESAIGAFLRADELDTRNTNHREPMFESLESDGVEEFFQEIPDPEADPVTQNPKPASNELPAKQESDDYQSSPVDFTFALEDQLDFTVMASDPGKSISPEESMEPTPLNSANIESAPTTSKTNPGPDMFGEEMAHADILRTNLEEYLSRNSGSNFNAMEEATPDNPSDTVSARSVEYPAETKVPPETMERSNAEPSPIQTQDSEVAQVQLDTQNANVWNEMGNVYFSSGAYDDAILAYRQAIELDSQFAWAYSNLALTLVQKGSFEEAILLYDRSIALFKNAKDKAVTWNRLGNLYRRQQDYDNAILAYQTADELDPDNATLSLRSRFTLLGSLMEEQPAYSV